MKNRQNLLSFRLSSLCCLNREIDTGQWQYNHILDFYKKSGSLGSVITKSSDSAVNNSSLHLNADTSAKVTPPMKNTRVNWGLSAFMKVEATVGSSSFLRRAVGTSCLSSIFGPGSTYGKTFLFTQTDGAVLFILHSIHKPQLIIELFDNSCAHLFSH